MKRTALLGLLYSFALFLLSGCAATQQVSQFSGGQPKAVCIAKHEAVREGVLAALEKGLTRHGVSSRVINAQYVQNHNMWTPSINPNNTQNCDAIMFYVANWAWDLAMYMHYANIWVTDPEMTRKLAQASYQTGGGFDKFIDAEEKILEMIDSIFTEYYSKQSTEVTPNAELDSKMEQSSLDTSLSLATESPESKNTATPSYIDELKALARLRDDGIITDEEFQKQKAKILAKK